MRPPTPPDNYANAAMLDPFAGPIGPRPVAAGS